MAAFSKRTSHPLPLRPGGPKWQGAGNIFCFELIFPRFMQFQSSSHFAPTNFSQTNDLIISSPNYLSRNLSAKRSFFCLQNWRYIKFSNQ